MSNENKFTNKANEPKKGAQEAKTSNLASFGKPYILHQTRDSFFANIFLLISSAESNIARTDGPITQVGVEDTSLATKMATTGLIISSKYVPGFTTCTALVFKDSCMKFRYIIVLIFAVILRPKSSQFHYYN